MEQFTKQVGGPFNGQETAATPLDYQFVALWALLSAMHRRLRAPLGGKAADRHVDILTEAQEISEHASIQEGAVGGGGAHGVFGMPGKLDFPLIYHFAQT